MQGSTAAHSGSSQSPSPSQSSSCPLPHTSAGGVPTGACVQTWSTQASSVQTSSSLQSLFVSQQFGSDDASFWQTGEPCTSAQVSVVQKNSSAQSKGVPDVHEPPAQTSPTVQALSSVHEAALFVCLHPVEGPAGPGTHSSFVHPLWSSQSTSPSPTQLPPVHRSVGVQTSLSSQGSLLLTYWQPSCGSQLSFVQALPSLQTTGLLVQVWFTQRSSVVHWFVSRQSASSLQHPSMSVLTHPPGETQLSAVQSLLSLQSSGPPPTHSFAAQ